MNRINTVAEALRIRALTVGNALHGTFWSNESGQKAIIRGLETSFKLYAERLRLATKYVQHDVVEIRK